MPEPLWTIQQLADYLALPVSTLYQWRHKGVGPAGMRIGRHIRYRPADIEAWLNEQSEEQTT